MLWYYHFQIRVGNDFTSNSPDFTSYKLLYKIETECASTTDQECYIYRSSNYIYYRILSRIESFRGKYVLIQKINSAGQLNSHIAILEIKEITVYT